VENGLRDLVKIPLAEIRRVARVEARMKYNAVQASRAELVQLAPETLLLQRGIDCPKGVKTRAGRWGHVGSGGSALSAPFPED
jgi:hypothetical protein